MGHLSPHLPSSEKGRLRATFWGQRERKGHLDGPRSEPGLPQGRPQRGATLLEPQPKNGAWSVSTHVSLVRRSPGGLLQRGTTVIHLRCCKVHTEVPGSPWVGLVSGLNHCKSSTFRGRRKREIISLLSSTFMVRSLCSKVVCESLT